MRLLVDTHALLWWLTDNPRLSYIAEAAISMIRRADPVPRPPAELTDDTFSYTLNVNFNEKK